MESVVQELRRAAVTLRLPASEIRELHNTEGGEVLAAVLSKFVASGDRRWWWEDFREIGTSRSFQKSDGWRFLPRIAPDPKELVWFIAEDDQLPQYPVFETTPETASALVGECYGFEYYLVAKNLRWLICENHHNVVYAVGEQVEQRLVASAA
jgi:hypothetical protein